MSAEVLAVCSMMASFINTAIYIVAIYRKEVRPHLFSWIIWLVIAVIAATLQIKGGAGAGAWGTAFGGFMYLAIIILSFSRGEKRITRSDWIALFCAFFAVPLWVLTDSANYAVFWIIFVELAGYYPTFRKGWGDPWRESVLVFSVSVLKNGLALLAIENYSCQTALYLGATTFASFALALMLVVRRRGRQKTFDSVLNLA